MKNIFKLFLIFFFISPVLMEVGCKGGMIYNKCNGNCTNTRVHNIASHINGKLVKWYNLTENFVQNVISYKFMML